MVLKTVSEEIRGFCYLTGALTRCKYFAKTFDQEQILIGILILIKNFSSSSFNKMFKVFVFCFVLILNFNVKNVHGQTCNAAGQRKMDGMVAKLITIGNSGRKFPEDKGKELKTYCRYLSIICTLVTFNQI